MRIFLSRPHMSGREQSHLAAAFASLWPRYPSTDEFEVAVNSYLGGGLHCVGLSSGSGAASRARLRELGVTTRCGYPQ